MTAGAGHVHERTPGNRARPLTEPLPVQGTTAQHALATPPAFLFQTAHGGRVHELGQPHPTVCASDDRGARGPQLRLLGQRPAGTVHLDDRRPDADARDHPVAGADRDEPPPPQAPASDEPLTTICAGGNHHGLLMRNNGGGAEMVTPLDEPAPTVTTKGNQSLLVPYNGHGQAKPATEPLGTQPTRDRWALVDVERLVDDCGFRMLEPHEIAAAMAFPAGYIPASLTKRDRVKLAGNAVTPPAMAWITGRILQAPGGRGMSPAQNARPFPVIAAGAWSTRRPNTPASRKEGNAMASAIERRLPMIGGPPGDDVVFHGHAGAFHAPPGAGGRLVTIETPAGQPTGVLHHLVRHSPTGFSWGYRGSVPTDLARCLLAAVLGHAAVCPSCAGTTVVIYDFERDAVEPYDPGRHVADLAERCSACGDGLVIPTALYQQFKDDVVARWPQDDDWRITAGDIRSWLARHGTEGEW